MSRVHALCGVSAAAVGLVLVAPVEMASAQNAGQTLPPITVEAPTPARAAAKPEPASRTAGRAKRRNAAAAPRSLPPQPTSGSGSVGKDPTAYSVSDSGIGTKTDTPILVTPASVQVVPQQVLRDQQVIGVDQAVKNVSGVITGGGLSSDNGQPYATVFIRGFSTDTIFRDGTRLDSNGGDSNLYLQQFVNIDRVEVLKGPAAILYGAVEPGGILNIVTKQPQSTPAYSLEQQVGSFGLERTTINTTGPASQDGHLLYRLDTSYDSAGSQVDNVKTRNFFIAPVLLWNVDADNQVKAEFSYRSSLFGQNFGFLPTLNGVLINTNPSVNYNGGFSPAHETAYFAALSWMHRFDNDWSVKQRFVFSNIDVNSTGLLPFELGGGSIVSGAPTPSGMGVAAGINQLMNTGRNFNVTTDLTGHFRNLWNRPYASAWYRLRTFR